MSLEVFEMKFKTGDEVIVTVLGKQHEAVVVAVYPEKGSYQVSVDHGAGGFHIVPENMLVRKGVA